MRFRERIKKMNLKGIWERNAFYILLAVCVVVMGAVAWTSRLHQNTAPQEPPAQEKLAVTPSPEPDNAGRQYTLREVAEQPDEGKEKKLEPTADEAPKSAVPAPDEEENPKDTEPLPADTSAPAEAPQNKPDVEHETPDEPAVETAAQGASWHTPLPGTVITPFAAEQLVYWETLGAWRVHAAVDIKPLRDAAVCAAAGGTVKLAAEDDMLGYMIVIDHGKGLESCYASLTEDILVKAGDQVRGGQQIGTAGNTARSEQALGVHLHFSVWLDGQSVDPLSYISLP
jgi:murein DD-endopeptidase MepM/ murein hydrolase activator NlpD